MDPKTREQWILTALPTAVVLLGYSFFFFRPQQRALREKQQELQAVQHSATSEQEVAATRVRLQAARQQQSVTTEQIEQHERAMRELVSSLGKNLERFAVIEHVEGLLLEHEIDIVSQALIEQQSLSPRQKELLRKVEQRTGGGQLEYRRFRLEGRYVDVQRFLDRLAASQPLVLPVSLEAEKPEGERKLAWELVMVL